MKSLIFAVNCVASQQLEQCERSMNTCGHRVGCRLVSVPRTAAHSKAPLSSPWCLDSFSFFQDGELVLEHSTPCWTFWYLQKRQTNKMFLLVLFFCFFQVWLKLLLSVLFTWWTIKNDHKERDSTPLYSFLRTQSTHKPQKIGKKKNERRFKVMFIIIGQLGIGKKTFSSYPIAHCRRQIHIDR